MATIRELRAKFSATADSMRQGIRAVREQLSGIGTSTERAVEDSNNAIRNFRRTLDTLERAIQNSGNPDAFQDLTRAIQVSQRELNETGTIAESSMAEMQAAVEHARGDMALLGDSGSHAMQEIENAVNIGSTFRSWIDNVISLFNSFRSTGQNIWSSFTNAVRNTVGPFVSNIKSLFSEVLQSATSIFNGVKNAIMHPIQTARDVVRGIVGEIKGFFSGMKISLPKIKMPHFRIKNWSSNPLDWLKAMPSLNIDWYAKGGVFAPNSPRMIGIGDADVPEAALPLSDSVLGKIGAMIANTMPKSEGADGGVYEFHLSIPLDGRELVKRTIRYTAEELERARVRSNGGLS